MESIKLMLILLTILALGVVILPQTVSLFVGQHKWYYLDNPASDVPCQKCHADIYEELNLSTPHKKWGDPTKADTADCEACHRGNFSITYANASAGQPGLEAHAASTIECMYCHGNSTIASYHSAPIAGGFGLSDLATDTGVNATHLELVTGTAFQSNVYPGESEACIFCHTNVGVKFNFTTYTGFSLTVENTISGGNSYWTVSSITPIDFVTYTEVK